MLFLAPTMPAAQCLTFKLDFEMIHSLSFEMASDWFQLPLTACHLSDLLFHNVLDS